MAKLLPQHSIILAKAKRVDEPYAFGVRHLGDLILSPQSFLSGQLAFPLEAAEQFAVGGRGRNDIRTLPTILTLTRRLHRYQTHTKQPGTSPVTCIPPPPPCALLLFPMGPLRPNSTWVLLPGIVGKSRRWILRPPCSTIHAVRRRETGRQRHGGFRSQR